MATIPATTKSLRHVRKTIAFDGSAGNGAVGTVTVFTTTGWVWAEIIVGRCTEDIAAGALTTLQLGTSAVPDMFGIAANFGSSDARDLENGDGFQTGAAGDERNEAGKGVSGNIILTTDVQITNGTLVFDAWYRPITDDGALAGDDIDTAGDYVSGMAASTIDAAAFAAGAITATVIASNAIDADALASDAVTEIWAKAMSDLAAVPSATASVLDAINWMFELARNKRTQSSTTETLYKDDGSTALATSTKSDSGTLYTRGEFS